MKVLIVLDRLTLGGIQTQSINLAVYLSNKGMLVEFLSMQNDGESLIDVLEEHGFTYYNSRIFRNIHNRFQTYMDYIKLLKFLRINKYQVIIPFHQNSSALFSAIYKLGGAKICFFQERGGGEAESAKLTVLQKLSRFNDPIFVSNSKHGGKYLRQRMQLNRGTVHIVKNGLKLGEATKSREDWRGGLNISSNSKICLMLGNFFKEKDHPTLLKAWSHLIHELKAEDAYLLLAGSDPSEDQRSINSLKHFCLVNKIERNVIFLGAVKDNVGLIHAADIGLLSSKSEGLPNSVLEFMATQKPFIGTSVPGIEEAVGKDYEYLFNVGDFRKLAKHLHVLMSEPDIGIKIAAAMKQRFDTYFRSEIMGGNYYKLIMQRLSNAL